MKAIAEEQAMNWFPKERWCGFNLLGMFVCTREGRPKPLRRRNCPGHFVEDEFRWISDWGFNFARLPMDYHWWEKEGDWRTIEDGALRALDEALSWGERYGIHIQMNFHRAPGYCINAPAEPMDLFRDAEALEVCAEHWAYFARRFRGVPNERLSFDLVNEPWGHTQEEYDRVHVALIEAIRAEDSSRLIIANGGNCGRTPHPALYGLRNVGQAMRGYDPQPGLSHWYAEWAPADWNSMPPPAWPPNPADPQSGRAWLCENVYDVWEEARARGVFCMANEFGCYSKTPHAVVLAWMEDMLRIWKERNMGWALWNLSGSFGILDSEREDVEYESFCGHRLDRKMLDLLLRYR